MSNFKLIPVTDGWGISCKIAPRWLSLALIDDKFDDKLQLMALCRQATSHYLNQCCPRNMSPRWISDHKYQYLFFIILAADPQWILVKRDLSQTATFLHVCVPRGVQNICANGSRRKTLHRDSSEQILWAEHYSNGISFHLRREYTDIYGSGKFLWQTHWNGCHFNEIFETSCAESCRFDDFQRNQWRKFRQDDNIFVSMITLSK